MALKATIFKAELQIADLNRNYIIRRAVSPSPVTPRKQNNA